MKKWVGLLGLLTFTASITTAQVSYERIRGAAQEAQNWFTYSGRYCGLALQHPRSNQHRERARLRWSGRFKRPTRQFEPLPWWSTVCFTARHKTIAPLRWTPARGARSGAISGTCRKSCSRAVEW